MWPHTHQGPIPLSYLALLLVRVLQLSRGRYDGWHAGPRSGGSGAGDSTRLDLFRLGSTWLDLTRLDSF